MKKLLLAVVILTALVASAAIGSALLIKSQGGYAKATTPPVCQPDASKLLGYVNQERAKLGAPQLVIDNALSVSSQNKLQDMVANHYYGHDLPNGTSTDTFIRQQGVHAAWSEDVDINALSPEQDWQSFKNSPAHYASLTNAMYTRVGLSEQCTNFTVNQDTGGEYGNLVGKVATELTVVHLAAPEPAPQAPAPQVSAPATHSRVICTYYPAIESLPARSICN